MRFNRDTFESRVDRSHYDDSFTIEFRSRRYDVRYGIRLRGNWRGDPRHLDEYVERLIGGTLGAWENARVESSIGRDMANALLPYWEQQIHFYMERLEREYVYYAPSRYDNDYLLRPIFMGADFAGSVEDPKAKKKARALLVQQLDVEQRASFEKKGEFQVKAKDGKTYTIKTARSFNVVKEDGTKYCGQILDAPVEDQMLAQKLMLEHEPEKFFKNANMSPARRTDPIAGLRADVWV